MQQQKTQQSSQPQQPPHPSLPHSSFLTRTISQFLSFQRICIPLTSSYLQLIYFSLPFHIFIGYLMLAQNFLSVYAVELGTIDVSQPIGYRLWQILMYGVDVALVVVVAGAKIKYKSTIWYTTVKRIISIYTPLADINLFLTSLILFVDVPGNIASFLFAALISIFQGIFMTNCVLKKQQNYQSSHQLSLIFKIWMILYYLTNSLIVAYGPLWLYCTMSTIFGIFLLLWHGLGGYRLYFHWSSRKISTFFCGSIISGSMIFVLLIVPREGRDEFNLVQYVTALVVVLLYLYWYQQRKRSCVVSGMQVIEEGRRMKEYQLDLGILLEESDSNKDKECLLVGIICYAAKSCTQPTCWAKQTIVYDPLLKHTFNTKNIVRQKDSVVRYYLKCLYTRALQSSSKNSQLLLDYIQFCISQMGDLSSHCFLLGQLQSQYTLGFLDKIKYYKMKLMLQEQAEAFNKLIFGGKIQLNQVLESQDIYDKIMGEIDQYCTKSMEMWVETLKKEVDVYQLKVKMNHNFKMIPKITQKWNTISKFLSIQKQWKHIYLNYALYLKNQKIKNRDLAQDHLSSNNLAEHMPSMAPQSIPLNFQRRGEQYVSQGIYFDKKTTLMMCDWQQSQLKIIKVSRSFQALTGFTPNEVRGSPIDIILPVEIKKNHNGMVEKWIDGGHTTDQQSFYLKYTRFVTNQGEEIPTMVFFKLYIDLTQPQRVVKFVALMKSTQKDNTQVIDNISTSSNNFQNKRNSGSAYNFLQKDLMQQSHSSSLSLNPAKNIFLKQDNLQPSKSLNQVERIKQMMRLLALGLIIMLVGMSIDLQNVGAEVEDHILEAKIFSNLYYEPYRIASTNDYMIIGIGNQTALLEHIKTYSKNLRHYEDYPITRQSIHDQQINKQGSYGPYWVDDMNKNLYYDQVDLFYTVMSSVSSLGTQIKNRSNQDAAMLSAYINPSYDKMMNLTKIALHSQLSKHLGQMKNNQLMVILALGIILTVAAGYICLKIYHYYSNMMEVIDIIVQFNNEEIQKIISYWAKVAEYFRKMDRSQRKYGNQDHIIQMTLREKSQDQIQESQTDKANPSGPKASLNQKHKNLLITIKQKKTQYKTCTLTVFLLLLFVPAILIIQLANLSLISQLLYLSQTGFSLLKFFPTTSVMEFGFADKALHNYEGWTHYKKRFEATVSTVQLMIDFKYSKGDHQGQFYRKLQDYMFGNPCLQQPQILAWHQVTVDQCKLFSNKSFSNGISTYLRWVQPQFLQFLDDNITLSEQRIIQLSKGLSLATSYLADAIQTWSQQFTAHVQTLYSRDILYSILVSLLLVVLHILVFEIIVLRSMREDYAFMKTVFQICVPEPILTKEKVIKHRFYQSGILPAN